MYGMLLARHKLHPEFKQTGFFGQKPLVMFASDQVSFLYAGSIYLTKILIFKL